MISSKTNTVANIFISMNSAGAETITIGDVRKWLETVDSYSIPDTTQLVYGVLELNLENLSVYQIECGDCAPQTIRNDFLVSAPSHLHSPSMVFNYTFNSESI